MKQPKTILCPRCKGKGECIALFYIHGSGLIEGLKHCNFCGGTGSLLKPAKKPSTKPKPKRKAQ